jgi:hypothetical protein
MFSNFAGYPPLTAYVACGYTVMCLRESPQTQNEMMKMIVTKIFSAYHYMAHSNKT